MFAAFLFTAGFVLEITAGTTFLFFGFDSCVSFLILFDSYFYNFLNQRCGNWIGCRELNGGTGCFKSLQLLFECINDILIDHNKRTVSFKGCKMNQCAI